METFDDPQLDRRTCSLEVGERLMAYIPAEEEEDNATCL
jgi:hypothetical protein